MDEHRERSLKLNADECRRHLPITPTNKQHQCVRRRAGALRRDKDLKLARPLPKERPLAQHG